MGSVIINRAMVENNTTLLFSTMLVKPKIQKAKPGLRGNAWEPECSVNLLAFVGHFPTFVIYESHREHIFPFDRLSDTHWDLSSMTGKRSRQENKWDFPSSSLDKKSPFVIERRHKKDSLFCFLGLCPTVFRYPNGHWNRSQRKYCLPSTPPVSGLSFNCIWGAE